MLYKKSFDFFLDKFEFKPIILFKIRRKENELFLRVYTNERFSNDK